MTFDFVSWLQQQNGPFVFQQISSDYFELDTSFAYGYIRIYVMEEQEEIVEFRIVRKKDDAVKFFLHFPLKNEQHTKQLFFEMMETLSKMEKEKEYRILLCCSSAITTSFFAEKLNGFAKQEQMELQFTAKNIEEIYAHGDAYDAILLAPQIGYMLAQIQKAFINKKVAVIPSTIFGTYNIAQCISFVLTLFEEKKEKEVIEPLVHRIEQNPYRILIMALIPSYDDCRIAYQIIDRGKAGMMKQMVKPSIGIRDIEDILDVLICQCVNEEAKPFDMVGIAMSGIIHEGILDLPNTDNLHIIPNNQNFFPIQQYFEKLYHTPFLITNNVNAACYGFACMHPKYASVTMHSQPAGWKHGGQGIVYHGKLIQGSHTSAGEVKYLHHLLQMNEHTRYSFYQPEVMCDWIARLLVVNIAIIDPDVICVRCPIVSDMDALRRSMAKYIPEEHIPKLVYVQDFGYYIFFGQIQLCIDALYEKEIEQKR